MERQQGLWLEAKVAVIHKPEKNPNVVISTIAYLSGYQIVDFDNLSDAESWLLGRF